jgi:hypothetical protein
MRFVGLPYAQPEMEAKMNGDNPDQANTHSDTTPFNPEKMAVKDVE